MKATYTAEGYSPDKVTGRYVRRSGDIYRFCEVGSDTRFDIRQGEVAGFELPDDVRFAADALRAQAFGYVEWSS